MLWHWQRIDTHSMLCNTYVLKSKYTHTPHDNRREPIELYIEGNCFVVFGHIIPDVFLLRVLYCCSPNLCASSTHGPSTLL